MQVQVSLPKLQAMHADWQAAAVSKALIVEELKRKLEQAKAASLTFSATEVAEMLTTISGFYKAVGREEALRDLLRDLGSPVMTAAARDPGPPAAAEAKASHVRRIGS